MNLENCPLHRRCPFVIASVSSGQFSIARHFGVITFNSESYVYNPKTDELIRADVLKWWMKYGRDKAKSEKQETPEMI